ncbi:hypothetical protein [Spirosoma rhododendri]|uniref:Uncharacterized protein n=1 Tax=Spirosoma rhododendri TaxID=2728024 RepID=A0A7L5DSK4_9BACT|nr:hypothetical protein [Spirosoma rhododendri]QJD79548.1 hypothetical protein HH216_14850 [Spirosoma rhododendri]
MSRPTKCRWIAYGLSVFVAWTSLYLLASCKPKTKPTAPAATSVPTVDTARIRLQNQADASRSAAERATKASNSTVTNYDRDTKTYDSIRVDLR